MYKKAIDKINNNGLLLVFPINNRPEPKSLWSEFYPRSKMRWTWDSGSDNRVSEMWQLMKTLSKCREVVYSKWYQGRATFFSRELFTALIKTVPLARKSKFILESKEMLEILKQNSPLSTKELKLEIGLQGKLNEPTYSKALKFLFNEFLAVGFGEVEDGAFPSLAVGATSLIYEDLWSEAQKLKSASSTIERLMPQGSLTRKYLDKILNT